MKLDHGFLEHCKSFQEQMRASLTYTQQSRPFANYVSTSPTDVDRNSTNAITTSLGNGAWGINTASIWGNGSNGNAFGRAGVKDKLKSDFSGNRSIENGIKQGSGSLLESTRGGIRIRTRKHVKHRV